MLFKTKRSNQTKAAFRNSLIKSDIDISTYKLSNFRSLKIAIQEDESFFKAYRSKMYVLAYYGCNIIRRQKRINELSPKVTLETYTLKYGEELGELKYREKNASCVQSESNMIKRYGESEGKKRWKQFLEKSVQSESNMIKRYGESEGKKRWKQFCEKNSYTNTLDSYIEKHGEKIGNERYNKWRNRGYNTKVDYFIKRGLSENEAQQALSERQSTFSLEKLMEKHGETIGVKIWKERQDKWQKTLKSKPAEEIQRINSLKGLNRYGQPHEGIVNEQWFLRNPEKVKMKGVIYYLKFTDNSGFQFWKIGIAQNGVNGRFGSEKLIKEKHGLIMEVIFEKSLPYYDCYKDEQRILQENSNFRIRVDINGFNSTECFSIDVLN